MKVFKHTVSNLLWQTLETLMTFEALQSFRLVGGTCLSLLLGHRLSSDIDLFTDAEYGSIDFDSIDQLILASFDYVEMGHGGNNSMGKTYFIGKSKNECIKLDLFYTDSFVYPIIDLDGKRLASLQEVIAMKLEVIGHNGRKKDFWDLHELLNYFSMTEMLDFYEKRHPYGYSRDEILKKIIDFTAADYDFDPICLKGKYWELIKLDFEEEVKKVFNL